MKGKAFGKHLLALILSICVMLSAFPISALATAGDSSTRAGEENDVLIFSTSLARPPLVISYRLNYIADIYENAGYKVKNILPEMIGKTVHLTDEDMQGISLLILYLPYQDLNKKDIALMREFLQGGGRIVMLGENGGWSPAENIILSQTTKKLGGELQINTDSQGKGDNHTAKIGTDELPDTDLVEGVKLGLSCSNIAPISYSGSVQPIAYYYDSVWVVDQAVENGRILAISDMDCFNALSWTSPSLTSEQKQLKEDLTIWILNWLENACDNQEMVASGRDPNRGFGGSPIVTVDVGTGKHTSMAGDYSFTVTYEGSEQSSDSRINSATIGTDNVKVTDADGNKLVISNAQIISGEGTEKTTVRYTVEAQQPGYFEAGEYSIAVVNSSVEDMAGKQIGGKTVANFTVYVLPVNIDGPENVSIPVNGYASLSASAQVDESASEYGPFEYSYQWQQKQENSYEPIQGATGSSYVLPQNVTGTPGEYIYRLACTVTSKKVTTTVYSQDVTVTVQQGVSINPPTAVENDGNYTLSAKLLNAGSVPIVETGFVWGVMSSPTISLNNGEAATSFPGISSGDTISATANNLSVDVTYSARAYVKTADGNVVYSAPVSFGNTGNAGTFSVTNNQNNTFTVTLTDGQGEQIVFYRTVNGSAVGGTHFQHTSGVLVFEPGETTKTVAVTEYNVNSIYDDEVTTGYSNADRTYSLELYKTIGGADIDGNKAKATRTMTGVQNVDRSVFGDFLITAAGTNHNHGDYDDDHLGWTNGGQHYNTAKETLNIQQILLQGKTDDQQRYWQNLEAAEVQYHMTFQAKEVDNGYQHIQIALGENIDFKYSPYQGGWQTASVNTDLPDDKGTALYQVIFQHGGTKKNQNWATYYLPNASGSPQGCSSWEEGFYDGGESTGSSYVTLPVKQTYMTVGYGASGDSNDKWTTQKETHYFRIGDTQEPQLLAVAPMAQTAYSVGEEITIALIFDEIVDSQNSTLSNVAIHTNLTGALSYAGGANTNVLYFTGTVTSPFTGGEIQVTSIDGNEYIRDMCADHITSNKITNGRTNITLTGADKPTVNINSVTVKDGSATASVSTSGADLLKYCWTDSADMPDAGWLTAESASSATLSIPVTETGTRYLHVMAINQTTGNAAYDSESYTVEAKNLIYLNASAENTNWAQSRTVILDTSGGTLTVQKPDGTRETLPAGATTYTAQENGKYTFTLKSGTETVTKIVTVAKIDRTGPKVSFNGLTSGWQPQFPKITLTGEDENSGLESLQYKLVTSKSSYPTQGLISANLSGGSAVISGAGAVNGINYIYYIAKDKAGNLTQGYSTAVKVDDTVPTITVSASVSEGLSAMFSVSADYGVSGGEVTFTKAGDTSVWPVSGTVTDNGNGSYTLVANPGVSEEGTYQFTVTTGAGKTATVSAPAICKVTLDAGEGVFELDSQSTSTWLVVAGGKIMPPEALNQEAPIRTGYTLSGWYTSDSLEEKYDADQTVNSDLTLYAGWQVKSYTITYDLNGGVIEGGNTNPASYTVEDDTFTLKNPVKEGVIFLGWSGTDLTGDRNKTVTIVKGSTGDRAYTANWSDVQVSMEGWIYGDSPKEPVVSEESNPGNADVTYTYYTDIGCTSKTTSVDGADTVGGRPVYAGTYYVKAEIAEANGYNAASGTASFTIEPKTIGIEWGETQFTYNGEPQAPTATATGLVDGDECKITVSGVKKDTNEKSGENSYTAAAVRVNNANYKLPSEGATTQFTIVPAALTVEWGSAQFTYNGQTQAPSAMLYGVVKDEQVEVSVSGGQVDAGKYTATASISDKNYVIKDGETVSFKIEPKTLTDDMVSLSGGTLKGESYEYAFTNNRISPAVIVKDGNRLTSGDYTISGDTEKTAYGQYMISVEGTNNYTGKVEVKWNITDPCAPSATITVGDNSWNKFWNTVTFGLFFKETKRITISGVDGENESGVDTVLYYTSETPAKTVDELVDVQWTEIENNGSFNIEPNRKLFIYAKVTDKAGNSVVVNSDGIVFYTDAQQITEELTFTRLDTEDLTASVVLNANTISEILCGTTALRAGTDYIVNNENGVITFKADWLNTLTAGKYTLTIRYDPLGVTYPSDPSSDSAAPADTEIMLTVQKAQGSVTDISDLSRVYDGAPVDDVTYTASSKGNVTVEYKQQDAADNTYTEEKPVDVGRYTVRVTVAEDEYYTKAYGTADFAITYLDTPNEAYTLLGTEGKNGWYISDVTVSPADGYTIAESLNGAYTDSITLTESVDGNYNVYLKNTNGQMTDAILVGTVKIDKEAPDITVTGSTEAYLPGDTVTINVSDSISGVSKVEVCKDGGSFVDITASYERGYTVLENGTYTFRVTDNAGLTSEKQIIYDKLDSTKPVAKIDSETYENGTWATTDITLSVSNAAYNLGTTTFQYKVDDGAWQNYTNEILVSKETNGTKYTFKAISASGVESDEVSIEVKIDKTVPNGDIKIRENSVKKLINVITFGLFFNENVDVTITGEDSLSGVSKIEYYRSEEILSQEQVNEIVEWTNYTSISETAEDAKKFVYYVKITDNAGNAICFGSDGVTFDLVPPVIDGITNGATYYTTQSVTVSDVNLKSVTMDGEQKSDTTFTLEGDVAKSYTIVAIDKADNKTEYTVFMKPIESLAEDIQSLTTENVTSANEDAVNEVKSAVSSVDITNATDAEKAALEIIKNSAEALLEQIAKTEAELGEVIDGVGSYSTDSVKSEDKDEVESLVERIDTLLEGENLTEEEKNNLEAVKDSAETLLEQIAEAESAGHTENIGKVENITADNVIAENADDLTAAKEDLENALKEYGDNYTEEEKTDLQEKLDQINGALESLENAEAAQDAITALPDTVKPDDMDTEQLINDAKAQYDALTEHEKSLVSEEAKEKLESLLAALRYYEIIVGDGGKWKKGTQICLSFTANGSYLKFIGIEVDGKAVDKENYTAVSGSTVITLKAEYLETLSVGKHILTVQYTDGEASCEFEVLAKDSITTPGTGDSSDILLWIFLLFVSGGVLGVATYRKKKQLN